MNYKKIILLGVDLNDPRYFFEHPDSNVFTKKFAAMHKSLLKSLNRSGLDTVNAKTTKTYGCLPIDQYLYKFNSIIKKNGVELYTGNKSSKLAEGLPIYEFPNEDFETFAYLRIIGFSAKEKTTRQSNISKDEPIKDAVFAL